MGEIVDLDTARSGYIESRDKASRSNVDGKPAVYFGLGSVVVRKPGGPPMIVTGYSKRGKVIAVFYSERNERMTEDKFDPHELAQIASDCVVV